MFLFIPCIVDLRLIVGRSPLAKLQYTLCASSVCADYARHTANQFPSALRSLKNAGIARILVDPDQITGRTAVTSSVYKRFFLVLRIITLRHIKVAVFKV